ncbi:TspO/MBR family protein [Roseospirillum parvum]|uniref:Tryptophan-rich sensory protein n=1 Tax=Roseospirillum parvum TaxID=83401 RepID=A0A1G7TK25_9PROT|nr:TspO/MBR family protein [Roseospirillum parvum]SDG35364.1 tryptophan-rich sensory protein [Roseospirillum parvum]
MDLAAVLAALAFILVNFVAASSAAIYKPDSWYENLRKPRWNPPNKVFPIAWAFFYSLLALGGWLAWQGAEGGEATMPLMIYGVHMALNARWSYFFFGMKRIDLSLMEATLMWLSILATILAFFPVDPVAAWVLVPYLGWVTFATILNTAILLLNRPGKQGGGVRRPADTGLADDD